MTDVVGLGDEIIVKCLGVDKKGRLNFSRKQALPKEENDKDKDKEDQKKNKKEED